MTIKDGWGRDDWGLLLIILAAILLGGMVGLGLTFVEGGWLDAFR